MSGDKLAVMVNQIGRFFAHRGEDEAVRETAEHLRKFWSPAMRAAIVDHLSAGHGGMDPLARRAVLALAERAQAAGAPVRA